VAYWVASQNLPELCLRYPHHQGYSHLRAPSRILLTRPNSTLLAQLCLVSPPGLTRCGLPLTRTSGLSFHAFGLRTTGRTDSYIPCLRMHACIACLPPLTLVPMHHQLLSFSICDQPMTYLGSTTQPMRVSA
jgi:hypothetical protein